ncbi:MAG TPA: DUF2115 domain-containing protein [Methanosarcinaceae archaeon]|nr:DUF2115 domain-containing protein [Methanosarcinaceae archaeon]
MAVLYYFCAIYNILITNAPTHPEGTPFSGGFVVGGGTSVMSTIQYR